MISFNLHKCNIFFDENFQNSTKGLNAYENYIKNLNMFQVECNFCHAKGYCVKDGHYFRSYLLHKKDLEGNGMKISIQRLLCRSCKHSHALLPEEIIPYGQFSIVFIFWVLAAYYLEEKSMNAICKAYNISIQQLKRWKKTFFEQKQRYLGVLNSQCWPEKAALAWLKRRRDYGTEFAEPYFCDVEKMPGQRHANPPNMRQPRFCWFHEFCHPHKLCSPQNREHGLTWVHPKNNGGFQDGKPYT